MCENDYIGTNSAAASRPPQMESDESEREREREREERERERESGSKNAKPKLEQTTVAPFIV